MFETDMTTGQVISLYVGMFVFFFGLATILLKKNS